jgi:hypothetical protein
MKLKVYETFLGFKFVPSPDGIYWRGDLTRTEKRLDRFRNTLP